MGEQNVVHKTSGPITKQTLIDDLKRIGVQKGDYLMVHSSLSSLGWVCGGEQAVVEALLEVVTEEGSIIMSTQSSNNSDPTYWENPPVPEDWHEVIRNQMPAYHPALTSTRGMGRIVESFRTHPDVIRSAHPKLSFAAYGNVAQSLIDNHSINLPFGEESPLARLYERNSKILLLGVDYDSCTAMHLAEYRLGTLPVNQQGSAMMEDGQRVWKVYEEFDVDSDQFPAIGRAFEEKGKGAYGIVGMAETKLLPLKELVDFTLEYLQKSTK
ncbi:aminoglycoside N(3)-acetyltransferase [Bacillus sp. 2205SS5-2]|uniref:aminoglycoside N(3)-acetyltransferase n=1 Tax=Bacillus sp. 2205SS5-2 TaxID=3109031 RepID=UPI003004E574